MFLFVSVFVLTIRMAEAKVKGRKGAEILLFMGL